MKPIERVEITPGYDWLAERQPKAFYVYVLRDPRPDKNLQPIYVGKGKGRRAHKHWGRGEEHKNHLLRGVFGKIRQAGLNPPIEIVRYFDIEADAFDLEIELIAKYGRRDLGAGTLCNLTNGGDGISGYFDNLEVLKKHTESFRKRRNTPEFRAAQKAAMIKLNSDPVFAEKHANKSREINNDPARKQRFIKLISNSEFQQIRIEKLRKAFLEPELAEPHAERMRARLAKPEQQDRIKAGVDSYWIKYRTDRNAKLINTYGMQIKAMRQSGYSLRSISRTLSLHRHHVRIAIKSMGA